MRTNRRPILYSKVKRPVDPKVTKSWLIDLAIQSLNHRGNYSEFWEAVEGLRKILPVPYTNQEIQAILDSRKDLITSKYFAQQDYEKSLPASTNSRQLTYELGQARSGCIPVPDKPTAQAQTRAQDLLEDVVKQFGWEFSRDRHSIHQHELDLHIYNLRSQPRFTIGPQRVCINWDSSPVFKAIRADDLAAIIVNSVSNPKFIDHICQHDSGYKLRLLRYQYQRKEVR